MRADIRDAGVSGFRVHPYVDIAPYSRPLGLGEERQIRSQVYVCKRPRSFCARRYRGAESGHNTLDAGAYSVEHSWQSGVTQTDVVGNRLEFRGAPGIA